MKNFYTSVVALFIASVSFAQNGQFSNNSFENWSTTNLYDDLTEWTTSNSQEWRGISTIDQSTDAFAGNYSCELSAHTVGANQDTVFGYVFHGSVGQNGPDGGILYTDNFDEVRVQFKCDIPAGDTLYLITSRYIWGSPIDLTFEPVAYGTVGTWTQASISVPSNTQDALFIGFVLGDPFNEHLPSPGAWARIDNVELYSGGVQASSIPDPGFEQWTSVSTESPTSWYTLNDYLASMGLDNAIKTIDANSGSYAIEMVTVQDPNSGDSIPSMLSTQPLNIWGPGNLFSPGPYNATPTTLSFAYKYSPSGADQAALMIQFLEAGVPVGTHQEIISAPQSTWQTVSIPLTITGTPDSMQFIAFSGENPGSTLKLDDLSLSGGDVGIDEFAQMHASVYPNPATTEVMIKAEGIYNYEITDMSGTVVLQENSVSGIVQADISQLAKGAYLIQLRNQSETQILKLIVE